MNMHLSNVSFDVFSNANQMMIVILCVLLISDQADPRKRERERQRNMLFAILYPSATQMLLQIQPSFTSNEFRAWLYEWKLVLMRVCWIVVAIAIVNRIEIH